MSQKFRSGTVSLETVQTRTLKYTHLEVDKDFNQQHRASSFVITKPHLLKLVNDLLTGFDYSALSNAAQKIGPESAFHKVPAYVHTALAKLLIEKQRILRKDINDLANKVFADLKSKKFDVEVRIHFNDVYVLGNPITLKSGHSTAVIQPVTKEILDNLPQWPGDLSMTRGIPTSIATLRLPVSSHDEIRNEVTRLTLALRLADNVWADRVCEEICSKNCACFWDGSQLAKTHAPQGPWKGVFPSSITTQRTLESLWRTSCSYYSDPMSPPQIDHLYVSLDRYFDALTPQRFVESSIADVISALEALWAPDDQRELTHRLKLNLSKFIFGLWGIDCRNLMREAYDIRSKYVHGAPLKQNDANKAWLQTTRDSKLATLLTLTRFSILFFLTAYDENGHKLGKKSILKLCEEALISSAATTKLNQSVRKSLGLLNRFERHRQDAIAARSTHFP